MFSCANARAVGLDSVLVGWLDQGVLQPGSLSFSPLEALDPEMLVSHFGRELQVAGHSPQAALDHYDGALPSGFDEALRTSNWAALDWWFYELPQLLNLAPPSRGAQLPYVPLQRVLLPGFLADADAQAEMVKYLLARGANPRQKLPFDPEHTVVGFARSIKSPMVALLDEPATGVAAPTRLAHSSAGDDVAGGSAKAARESAPRSLRQAARFDSPSASGETTR
jgi:hypothetical protein